MDTMRVCAKINLDALAHNIKEIERAISTNTDIICVIKADGYGHGAVQLAKELLGMKRIHGFAVATCEEAKELYNAGIDKPILILGYTFEESYETVIRYGFRPTIFSYETAQVYSALAEKLDKPVYCHIKIDSGMGRIGYRPEDAAADEIARIFSLPNLVPEGIFTHFARADETDKTATEEQLRKFRGMIASCVERGVHFSLHHCSNSAAIMDIPSANMDLVRAGIILYGMMPSDEVSKDFDFQPLMSIYSHIVHLKFVEKGDAISYGGIYEAPGRRRIATVPVGYADGYSRGLSNKGYVLVRGQRARIVGRICMDQFMIDVTDIPEVSLLDEVTLLGQDGNETITMEELGAISGRFNYEFACDLGNRIPRLYYRGGRQIEIKKYYE